MRFWSKLPEEIRLETESERVSALNGIAAISKDLRELSHHLHPQILDDLGLETAIRQLCELSEERYSTPVRFSTRNVPSDVPSAIAISLYRIVQEALQNVAKHASAESVDIALVGGKAALEPSIRDNGIGFDPQSQGRGLGLGLISMAQRAKLAGGDFEIQSRPKGGTHIHVSLPFEVVEPQDLSASPAQVTR